MNRRDALLILSGAATMSLGGLADGMLNAKSSAATGDLADAITRLQQTPESIGAWTSRPESISPREQRVAGIRGYVRRQYEHRENGYRVELTLLCGPAGPMSVHPPTACFEGTGYSLAAGPVLTTLQPGRAEFNRSTFRHHDIGAARMVRVFWAWGTDGAWQAPTRPRLTFRGQPWLYKLYVTDRWVELSGQPVVPQAEAFLDDMLPVMHSVLAPPVNRPSGKKA